MKKLVNIVILLIISMFVMTNMVWAEEITASMTSSTNTVKQGETVTVTLNLSSSDGLNAAKGTITYSPEALTFESMNAGSSAWSVPSTEDKGNGQINFTIARSSYDISGNALVQISFKAKEDTNIEQTVISISDIVASNSNYEDVEIADANISINITELDGETQKPSNNENSVDINNTINVTDENNSTNNLSNNLNNTSINVNNTNTSKNTATGKLPQTGTTNTIISIALITIIAIGVGTYASYRRYKNM